MSNIICEFCYEDYTSIIGLDKTSEGWFCDTCDAFNFFHGNRDEKDQFLVILERKAKEEGAKIPRYQRLKRNLSPLRYPGGKSRMIDYLYHHIYKNKVGTLYSPFAGGASYELAMLESGVINKLVLNDLDYGVYSFWWHVLHMPEELTYRIEHANPSHSDYFEAQQLVKNGCAGVDSIEAGWATLLVNRLAYSGISKANPLGGKKGTQQQLLSRWNPKTLIKNINRIAAMQNDIELSSVNAQDFIEEAYWDDKGLIFIDPPYINKGADLYNVSMTINEHYKLANCLNALYKGFSGANLVITYDLNDITESLFDTPQMQILDRQYSI